MKLFILKENNTIIDINTEEISSNYLEINIENMDQFYKQIGVDIYISEELEDKVKELLDSDDTKVALSSYNIKHWVSNRSFGELIDMYENNEIKKPDMQREFVWDSLKSSRLIESIILGLPIPPLFLLETSKNEYEIIDGYQRLITLVNYVTGKPWYYNPNAKRKYPSKLSSKVSKEIAGKTFENLEKEFQRIIKRSTIPLIEFKQLVPENYDSKYLIFERINTGSEKLNSMQIRKSLVHGEFMKSLYECANRNSKFLDLFSVNALKKDEHVEAFLRILVMSEIYFGTYISKTSGIKYILNEYCENKKNEKIDDTAYNNFEKAINFCYNIFDNKPKNMFRRIETINGREEIVGNLNISILEAFIGILSKNEIQNFEEILTRYKEKMKMVFSLETDNDNPFTTSTGTIKSIRERFKICEEIIIGA